MNSLIPLYKGARSIFFIFFTSLMLMNSIVLAQRVGTTSIFLEPSRVLADGNVHFPQIVNFAGMMYVFYQRIDSTQGGKTQALAYKTSIRGFNWSGEKRLVSNIPLVSDFVPPIFSLAHNDSELAVVVSISGEQSDVFTIRTNQNEWRIENISNKEREIISPELFASKEGMMLFASQRTQENSIGPSPIRISRSIIYTFRSTGGRFGDFRLLPTPENQSRISNPYLLERRGIMYLAYESRAFLPNIGESNQIYLTKSSDQGNSWSNPVLSTDFVDLSDRSDTNISPQSYINQNPILIADNNDELLLLVDRNRPGNSIRVSLSHLNEDGSPRTFNNRDNEYISVANRSSSVSAFIIYEGRQYILYYYDLIGTSQIHIAWEGSTGWSSQKISSESGMHYLPRVVMHEGKPNFIWLRQLEGNPLNGDILYRQPDLFVAKPIAQPLSYTLGLESNSKEVLYTITVPNDPSGILSLSYVWSQNETVSDDEFINFDSNSNLSLTVEEHGKWNLFLRARDKAGNTSEYSRTSYTLDLVAPKPISFGRLPLDEDGYIISNTIDLSWIESTDSDIAGYQVRFSNLGNQNMNIHDKNEFLSSLIAEAGDNTPIQATNTLRLNNADNGLWALIVNPVDRVGNIGEAAVELIRLNKYIPVTQLNSVSLQENILGEQVLTFNGRGYSTNGIVNKIIFDRDAQEPWDHELLVSAGDYQINSDNRISGIILSVLQSGEYNVILSHTERGLYRHNRELLFEINGAVKLGDYSLYQPEKIREIKDNVRAFSVRDLAISIIVILLLLIIVVSLYRIRSILKDSKDLREEVIALVEGQISPSFRLIKEGMATMKKRGMGLRSKFTILMLILVIAVVLVIAVPLSNFILLNQRQILAQGLEDRIEVMLEGLSTTASTELNSNNVINIIRGLGRLNNQVTAMEEIEYITITARPNPNNPNLDSNGREYIWSTNDPLIFVQEEERQEYLLGIDNSYRPHDYFTRASNKPSNVIFSPGIYQIQDSVSERITREIVPAFNSNIEDKEIVQLVENLNLIVEQRVGTDLQISLNQENELRRRLDNELERYISIFSEPEFSVENYDINLQYYTFFYPVYWYNNEFVAQYQGTIRLGISTETINQQIRETQNSILLRVTIFAIIAIVAGLVGAFLLASITVNPIRKLVTGVERIRDSETKIELKENPIVIETGDELNFLSDTVNQMTNGLIKAEIANKSLMLGKDVQKMFITLDKSPYDEKTKATTRYESTDFVEFFGYYEGAKGVSGDYFFYKKVDDHTYAMIKCDVSGKDIEAALIMVTVATLFLQHFDNWQEKQLRQRQVSFALKQEQPPVLSELASTINEIIYERDFKGKFAAFNMLMLNEQSGQVLFCNAGDNIVHIYRNQQRKVVSLQLAKTPAAGAVSESILGMPVEFPEEQNVLESGDILLLFTDGYEESRRYLRHNNWQVYQLEDFTGETAEEGLKALEKEMKPFLLGQDDGGFGESFSIPRIHAIIEAVMNHHTYVLSKFRNPISDEQLTFDFSAIKSTLSNLILALMSVEKVFRLVPLPKLTHEDRISVDKKIDDFLKKCFLQYGNYFHHPLPEDENSLYRRFSHISEDSQYDDLTILAVKKNQESV